MTDPRLATNFAHLAAIEQQLEDAREYLRTAARGFGIPTRGLFAKSRFVLRETAYKWIDEAREDAVFDDDATARAYERGRDAGSEETLRRIEAFGAISRSGKYDHLRQLPDVLARLRDMGLDSDSQGPQRDPQADAKAIAKQIIAAGAKARGASGPLPPIGSLARRILDAGAKRRGEDPDDQATDDNDDEGAPNGDDDEAERKRRKARKAKKHADTDEIPEELTPPERKEPDPALDEMRRREREEGRRMRMRTADELEALSKPEAKVVDLADAIIAAGRKARGLPPLKK
jgi:hypothetical protein